MGADGLGCVVHQDGEGGPGSDDLAADVTVGEGELGVGADLEGSGGDEAVVGADVPDLEGSALLALDLDDAEGEVGRRELEGAGGQVDALSDESDAGLSLVLVVASDEELGLDGALGHRLELDHDLVGAAGGDGGGASAGGGEGAGALGVGLDVGDLEVIEADVGDQDRATRGGDEGDEAEVELRGEDLDVGSAAGAAQADEDISVGLGLVGLDLEVALVGAEIIGAVGDVDVEGVSLVEDEDGGGLEGVVGGRGLASAGGGSPADDGDLVVGDVLAGDVLGEAGAGVDLSEVEGRGVAPEAGLYADAVEADGGLTGGGVAGAEGEVPALAGAGDGGGELDLHGGGLAGPE